MVKASLLAAGILAGAVALAGCQDMATSTPSTAPAGSGLAVELPRGRKAAKEDLEFRIGPLPVVELPSGWKAVNDGANVRLIVPHDNDIVIRPVPAAARPGDALAGIAAAIHDEVHDFKTVSVEDMTLAGRPAIHVIGKGAEADDGDPSNAEVFVFMVGKKVYLACVHGENTAAKDLRPTATKVLDSAKGPPGTTKTRRHEDASEHEDDDD